MAETSTLLMCRMGNCTEGSNPSSSASVCVASGRRRRIQKSGDDKTCGEMTEWPIVLAWNAGVGRPTVGSNPTLSAIHEFE